MSTVVANSTRVNSADSSTGWGGYNASGPSPAAEGQNAYQGSPKLAVNKKVNSTTSRGGVDYNAGSTIDTTQAANALVLLKGVVADNPDVNTTWGVEMAIGSAEGQHYEYNVAGSGANNDWYLSYNAVGGVAGAYLFVAIDPSISGWREITTGSPNLAAIDFYAIAAQFIDGQAKSENVALDAIDVGTGLTYTGTAFSFQDGVDEDQGITSNRWGWAAAVGSAIFLRGVHTVNATGTDTSTVFFPDGYHSDGLFGIACGSTSTEFAGSYTGLGKRYAAVGVDTRPDFTDTGTATVISGDLKTFNQVDLASTATVTGSIEAVSITGDATFTDALLISNSDLIGNQFMVDPDLTKFENVRFARNGSGYGIVITTPGTYNIDELSGLNETGGFGADGSLGAGIYNNSGGLVTLERLDGATETPTVRNGSGATTDIPAVQVSVTFTGLPVGAEFRVYDDDADGNAITIGTNRDGVETLGATTYQITHDSAEAGNVIYAQVIDPLNFEEEVRAVTLSAVSQTVTFSLQTEENV